MIDAISSVGLPSFPATTHVPANFFNFSRPALVGGGGNLTALSSALAPVDRPSTSAKTRIPRDIVRSPNELLGDHLTPTTRRTAVNEIDRELGEFDFLAGRTEMGAISPFICVKSQFHSDFSRSR